MKSIRIFLLVCAMLGVYDTAFTEEQLNQNSVVSAVSITQKITEDRPPYWLGIPKGCEQGQYFKQNGQWDVRCTRKSTKKRDFIIANVIMGVGGVADTITTVRAVRSGATEGNPLVRPFANSYLKMGLFKAGAGLGASYFAWKQNKPWAPALVGGVWGAAAMWNLKF